MFSLATLPKSYTLFLKRWLSLVCCSLWLLASSISLAGGVRVIQNPDFDIRRDGTPVTIPTPSGATWYYWGDDNCTSRPSASECIAGWRTTDTGQYVEVAYASTYGNFGDQNNRIVAELNASSQSRLYQPICLQAGEVVTMNYYFSARTNGGSLPQQVAAGLWAINDTGPIGGAISSQNSNPSSSALFTPQTAIFTAPADGLYQIGLEAVFPATGSNGNLIDDIRVILKPLIDLNTQPKFTMPEGTSGNSLQLRVNGTVQTPTVVALRKISGSASSDIDFTLGTPVGLAGTTPTISHVYGSDLWLVTIPPGEYDAGQGIFGNAKYGVQIPIDSIYDVLREGTEPLIFELQTPSADGSDPIAKWDRTNPICEGPSTNQVEAEIIEVLPVIKVNKNVIGRVNAADQFTTVIRDSLGNVVSSTASSLTAGGGVTTSGATTGLFTAAGKFEADFDQTYTISEVMAAGSVNTLSAYTSSISCTNARVIGPATVLPSGVGQSFSISPQDSDDINCTITNAPLPVITLNKALASTRAAPNDQFTVQIKNGVSVVNAVTNSTSTGASSTITGGTGTTGATILQPSISYTLTEVAAGSPLADLSLYNTFISCTNTYGASSTALPSGNGQSFNITPQGNDNITCTLTNIAHEPRVTLQKALTTSGRLNAADQFTVQINQGVTTLASGTTTGSGTTVTGGMAGPIFLSAGVTYTLTEVMAGGSVSPLSAYDTQISCTNTNGSSATVLPSGSGTSFSLTPQLDDVISCTISNGNPRIRVNKTVTSVRNDTDRFTTHIRTGGAGGTIVSNTTTGGGTLTTGAVGSYTAGGYYLAKSGTTYTITEAVSGAGSNINHYSASISCTNATAGSSTVLPSGTGSSFNLTPQFNDDITCTLTNITHPVIAFNKALSSARLLDTNQFLMRLQGGATNVSTTTTGTGSTVTNGAIAATQVVAATSYTLSETAAGTTNLANYNSRIACTNSYGASSTVLPSGAGTSFNITPQLGDNISCTLTNGREPRLRLNKTIATGLVDSDDRFTTEIRDNTGLRNLLSSTSNNPLTGGAVTTTGGVGTYTATGTLMVTAGTTYNLTEVISAGTSGKTQYDTTISCTNAVVSGTALPSGSGQNFTITPTTGDNITCTLTNSPKAPRLTLNKKISGVIDNVAPVDTFRTQIYQGVTLVSNGNSANGTVLTTNTPATVFPQTYSPATAYTATANTTYTLTEAIATGSTPLANYSTFISCVNTRSDGPFTTLPDGSGQSFNVTVKHGDNITCTLDNGPARISLSKVLANNRLANTNQFTMEIRNGTTVLNSTVSSTTAGQDDTITPGSGTTGVTYVAGGGTYNLREVASGGTNMTNYETRIDCTNSNVGSPTVLPSTTAGVFNTTQSYNVTPIIGDDINCVFSNKRTAPRIRISKVLGGPRYAAADQFTLEVRNAGNTSTLATATTTGATSNPTQQVNYTATIGTSYTIREIIATGSSSTLADYIVSYSCINNATGVTTTGNTSSLTFTAAKYDDLECTFTNTPRPRIKVNKTVNVSLIDAADRFTTQIRRTSDNALLSNTSSSATAGGGVVTGAIATFPSTATATGTYQAIAGTALTITEAITAGTSILSQYYTEISCVNAKTDSTTILPSGSTPPFTFTPQNGDAITCTLSNTPLPRLRVNKVVASIADATDRFTTQIRTGGVSGTVVSGTSNNAITGGGVLTTGGVATYNAAGRYQALVGTTYTFTEIISAGVSDISQYTQTISCSNSYAGSSTELPTGAYPYQVTPQLGDNINCTLTNNVVIPKIRVQKTVVDLADIDDRFITQIRTGGVSGTVVSNPNSSATVGGGVFTTGGAGTYPTLGTYAATVGTTYTFTEVFAAGTSAFSQYTTSISCTNARTAGPATTLPSGSVAPFNLVPRAGDDITCTLSNDVIQPQIKVNKIVSSLVDVNDRFTTQIRTGGVSGTVVSDTSASPTTGGGVLTTGGAATYNATGTYQGVYGTTYTLTEVLTAGSSNLAFQYDTSVSCTNARVGGPTTVLPTGSTQPFNIEARAGDDITCTLTNAVRQPRMRIHKTVSSLVDANDRFTTEIRLDADNSLLSNTSASTTLGGGVLTTGGVATYNATGSYQASAGTAYLLTESISAGTSVLNQYTTSMVCTNSFATSPTVLPSGLAQPFVLTPVYGDDITCTLTNSIKQPLIRVHKSVLSLINASDRFTTHIRTGGVGGTIVSDTSASATTGGGAITTGGAAVYNALGSYQAVIGTTYTLTEAISAGPSILAQYSSSMSCINLWTGSPTVLPSGSTAPFNITPIAGDEISCTFTNVATAYTIIGKVFLDNGKNAAIPHNGLQEADELGLGNITVRLTDCATTVYQTAVTDGLGTYALAIPQSLSAGTTLCVAEQATTGLVSVSGVAGNTGGSYSLAQDRSQFTLAVATNYTGVDFGNVAESQLTGTGTQTIAAGSTASYSHQFIAGTEGAVTFSTAQAPTPLLTWTSLVYLDTNCNASLDGADTLITTPINVQADEVLCLIQKVQSPSTAANGSQNVSTISASFAFAAPSAINRAYTQDDTTIIMDSGLVLVKRVREVGSCPSTGADVNAFTTNNQALPNALIEYQISYSNPSAGVVSNIVINDLTPSFTTFRSASCHTTPSSVLCAVSTAPSVGGVGAIQWTFTNNPVGLGSGQSGEVRFCVRVDQ